MIGKTLSGQNNFQVITDFKKSKFAKRQRFYKGKKVVGVK